MIRTTLAAAALVTLASPTVALADIPDPVRAMIEAAIETGDEEKVRTVIDLAKTTNPDDVAQLDALLASFESDLALAKAAEEAAAQKEIRSAGFFDNWTGQGELGAFTSTGNAENTNIHLVVRKEILCRRAQNVAVAMSEPTARDRDLEGWIAGRGEGDIQIVCEDRQSFMAGQCLHHDLRCRPDGKCQRLMVLDLVRNQPRDLLFFAQVEDLTRRIMDVGGGRGRFDATMGPPKHAKLAQAIHVTADGLCRDIKTLRQVLHGGEPGLLHEIRDLGLTFGNLYLAQGAHRLCAHCPNQPEPARFR